MRTPLAGFNLTRRVLGIAEFLIRAPTVFWNAIRASDVVAGAAVLLSGLLSDNDTHNSPAFRFG